MPMEREEILAALKQIALSRPNDAIALALRQDAPLYIEETVLDASSFPFLFKGEKQTEEELAAFKTFLDHISPEDFGDIEQL